MHGLRRRQSVGGAMVLKRILFILAAVALGGLRADAQEFPAEPPPAETAKEEILGAPPAFDLSGEQQDLVRVEAEARLHQEPAVRSPTLVRVEVAADYPVVERRGSWARVRYGSWTGWVLLDGDDVPDPFAQETAAAVAWPAPSGPDPEHLLQARGLLTRERVTTLGPYVLYTDVTDDELLADLSHVASQLPALFEERFGLPAVPGENEVVVLYAAEKTYDAYAAGRPERSVFDSSGHAVGGLAVLSVGDRQPSEVRSLMVHEITHLLTFRALGQGLPYWLTEGLAEDLAYCRVAKKSGELLLATLDRWRASTVEPVRDRQGQLRLATRTMRGGPALSLELLRAKWKERDRLPLEVLLDLSQETFIDTDERSIHYSMSAFLVRYLLAGDDRAAVFRAFLVAVAGGEHADADTLLDLLETDWQRLEADVGKWLASPAALHGPKEKKR